MTRQLSPDPRDEFAERWRAELARDVLHAPPVSWHVIGQVAMAVEEPLTDLLQSALSQLDAVSMTPTEPAGLQLGLGLLGARPLENTAAFLMDWILDGHPLSDEAALAIGQIAGAQAPPPLQRDALIRALRETTEDRSRDIRVRVATATALLDLGDVEGSLPVLHATLITGTPFGLESSERLGFPAEQSRWALERRMVIDAIRRHTGGEDFGLSPENPWPVLAANADRARKSLASGTHTRSTRR